MIASTNLAVAANSFSIGEMSSYKHTINNVFNY